MARPVSATIGVLVLALTAGPTPALDLTPYLSVTDGNTWTFLEDFHDLTNGDRETFITLAGFQGTDLVDGVTTHRFGVYGEIDPAGAVVDITNLAWDAEGLQTYRLLFNSDGSEPLVEATAGDLELMLPRAMEIGQTVTDSARFEAYQQGSYFGYGVVTNQITLEGLETVGVPAGVFETIRIFSQEVFEEHTPDGAPVGTRSTDRRYWLDAGVGFVKQEESETYDDRYGDGYERTDTVTLLAAIVDGTLLGNPTYIDNIERVYIAYYGRPGDPDGTVYWTGRFANNDGVWGELISAFAASREAQERFGGMDNETLLRNLYQQMFNRDPDDAGLAYYLNELDTGARTLEGIMLDVLNGASGDDLAIVDNKLAVARYFTEQVRGRGRAYGDADIPAARNVLDQVTADPASIDTAKALADQVIETMATTGFCGDLGTIELIPAAPTGTFAGTLVAPGFNRQAYQVTCIDASAFAAGGWLVFDITMGDGESAGSFDLFPEGFPIPTDGSPVGTLGGAYDTTILHPLSISFLLLASFLAAPVQAQNRDALVTACETTEPLLEAACPCNVDQALARGIAPATVAKLARMQIVGVPQKDLQAFFEIKGQCLAQQGPGGDAQ